MPIKIINSHVGTKKTSSYIKTGGQGFGTTPLSDYSKTNYSVNTMYYITMYINKIMDYFKNNNAIILKIGIIIFFVVIFIFIIRKIFKNNDF
jgi:hypothetical protein